MLFRPLAGLASNNSAEPSVHFSCALCSHALAVSLSLGVASLQLFKPWTGWQSRWSRAPLTLWRPRLVQNLTNGAPSHCFARPLFRPWRGWTGAM